MLNTLMPIIDQFIGTAINRLSSENGSMVSHFFLDLRTIFPDRQRITQKLLDDAISVCASRGIHAQTDQMNNLLISVNLASCRLNYQQAEAFDAALAYARQIHGNFN